MRPPGRTRTSADAALWYRRHPFIPASVSGVGRASDQHPGLPDIRS